MRADTRPWTLPRNFSRYDLTCGPRRKMVAPPPVQKLVFQVSINSSETRTEGLFDMMQYTLYRVVTVHRTGGSDVTHSIVYRRYSEFVKLYDKLAERYGWVRLPPLPRKKFFGNMDRCFVNQRRQQLVRFLENLVEWRDNDPDVVAFLGISKEEIITEKSKGSSSSSYGKAHRSCLRSDGGSYRSQNAVSWGRNTTY